MRDVLAHAEPRIDDDSPSGAHHRALNEKPEARSLLLRRTGRYVGAPNNHTVNGQPADARLDRAGDVKELVRDRYGVG